MKKSNQAKQATRTFLSFAQPALWPEIFGFWTPVRLTPVDGPGTNQELCAFWDALAEYRGLAHVLAGCDWDHGKEAELLADYGVEVW